MKVKKVLMPFLAIATGCMCLFTSACSQLQGILGNPGGETDDHEHTGWAWVDTDPDKHWQSPTCHPDEKRSEGAHVYSGDDDATCNTCGHVREVGEPPHEHTGWAWVNTDPDKHWKSPSCHPDEKKDEGSHVYDNDRDTTCNDCGHVREVGEPPHEHTGWAWVNTDPDKHWKSPACHPDVKDNEGSHVYDNDQDTTCDTCGHTRAVAPPHEHTWGNYVNTDPTYHWKEATCHEGVTTEKQFHDYFDEDDEICNTCGHTRLIEESNHKGWEYDHDDDYHWQYATCHPEVTRNRAPHHYDNDQDATCDCGYTRTIVPPTPSDSFLTYKNAGYESAAFEWNDSNAKGAKVEYKPHSGPTEYKAVDSELVRQKDSNTARADVLGLMGNALYDFKVTSSAGKTEVIESAKIFAYDRKGSYAHFNYTDGVGAYNDDGTPKSNAKIVYVTEATKNTVTAKIDGKTYTGIVDILQHAGTTTPLIVRIIGTVGAATWKKLVENNDTKLTPDLVVGMDGKTKLVDKYNIERSTKDSDGKYTGGKSKDITQATLIEDKINELDESVYKELIGLNSKIKYDPSKDEFDSCWNDCSIPGVKNVTVEGVGEDAKIFQWGFTFRNSSSIEVRNLTFDDYTEDACSFEANETGADSLSDFKSGNIWVHNNTFEEGKNYWDVCNEQDKHDGDGSTDFKGLKNITLSYNVYNGTHKTGLIGGGNGHATANVTFHHNWYIGCKARLPLGRQANMHMYNNYYNATTDTAISLRAGAYALIENCYFDTVSGKTSIDLQKDGTYGNGAAKLVNCINESGNLKNASGSDYYYSGSDRLKTVTNDNKFSKTFDTNSSLFYYANGKSNVGTMLDASAVPDYVKLNSGVAKRSNNMTGGGTTDPDIPDIPTGDTIIYIPEKSAAGTADGVVTAVSTDPNGLQYKTSSQEVNIDGTKISAGKALKIDTKVTITINISQEMVLTLYMCVDNIKIDGTTLTCETGNSKGYYEMTITLSAGTHTLTRGSAENQLYMLKLTSK